MGGGGAACSGAGAAGDGSEEADRRPPVGRGVELSTVMSDADAALSGVRRQASALSGGSSRSMAA
eukprot:15280276-Alexandrium_andersonii.AAC.1